MDDPSHHTPRTWRYSDETPAETASIELSAWIDANPDPDVGGIHLLRDRQAVIVYWKGLPPTTAASAQPALSMTTPVSA